MASFASQFTWDTMGPWGYPSSYKSGIDAVIMPVVSRNTIKRGNKRVVKLGDKEIVLNDPWMLPNELDTPWVSSHRCLIHPLEPVVTGRYLGVPMLWHNSPLPPAIVSWDEMGWNGMHLLLQVFGHIISISVYLVTSQKGLSMDPIAYVLSIFPEMEGTVSNWMKAWIYIHFMLLSSSLHGAVCRSSNLLPTVLFEARKQQVSRTILHHIPGDNHNNQM